jgi:hypothetical protein
MKEPPHNVPSQPSTPTGEDLAPSVRRAADADIPVAVVDLLSPGATFTPSRGQVGARYAPGETTIRELSTWGAGAFDAGLSLYPPPDPATKRVIVLPLESRNWLRHDDALERVVTELVVRAQASRGETSSS